MFNLLNALGALPQQPIDDVLAQLDASGMVPASMLEAMFPIGQQSADPFGSAQAPYAYDPSSPFNLGGGSPVSTASPSFAGQGYDAPPPAPSAFAPQSPQAMHPQNQGLMDALTAIQGMDWTAQPDPFRERMLAASGGGTGAQNARFEAMFDPRAVSADATASLAADPQFGHLFGGGSADPTVTQFASTSPPVEITDDVISQLANAGQLDGTSGMRLNDEQLQRAIATRERRRAEEAAALENMRWSPMDFVDPTQRMAMAYDLMNAEAQWQRQQQAETMKRLQFQAEQDAAAEDRALKKLGIEAGIANDKELLGVEKAKVEAAIAQAKADAERQGRLDAVTIEELKAKIAAIQADQANRLPYNKEDVDLRHNLRNLYGADWPKYYKEETGVWPEGVPDPVGGGMDTYGGTVYSPSTPGQSAAGSPARRPTGDLLERIAGLPQEEQVIAMRDDGWTDDQILARLKMTQPNRYGISLDYPTGTSGGYEAMKWNPMLPMMWDELLTGGMGQKTLFPGYDPLRAQQEFRSQF